MRIQGLLGSTNDNNIGHIVNRITLQQLHQKISLGVNSHQQLIMIKLLCKGVGLRLILTKSNQLRSIKGKCGTTETAWKMAVIQLIVQQSHL
jgi:hypothetical protein